MDKFLVFYDLIVNMSQTSGAVKTYNGNREQYGIEFKNCGRTVYFNSEKDRDEAWVEIAKFITDKSSFVLNFNGNIEEDLKKVTEKEKI